MDLGGNITLTGFGEIDSGNMVIVKKMVGHFVKKVSDTSEDFQGLKLTLGAERVRETSQIFQLHGLLDLGRVHAAEESDRNLLFAVDKVLKKLESTVGIKP